MRARLNRASRQPLLESPKNRQIVSSLKVLKLLLELLLLLVKAKLAKLQLRLLVKFKKAPATAATASSANWMLFHSFPVAD